MEPVQNYSFPIIIIPKGVIRVLMHMNYLGKHNDNNTFTITVAAAAAGSEYGQRGVWLNMMVRHGEDSGMQAELVGMRSQISDTEYLRTIVVL